MSGNDKDAKKTAAFDPHTAEVEKQMREAELKFGGNISTHEPTPDTEEEAAPIKPSDLPSYKSKKSVGGRGATAAGLSSTSGSGSSSSSSSSSSASSKARFSTPTSLGIQYKSEEQGNIYTKIGTINGYTFDIPPVNRFHSKSAEQKFAQLTGGSVNPVKFEANRFDHIRERLQTSDKRNREGHLQAIAVLYAEGLGDAFMHTRNLLAHEAGIAAKAGKTGTAASGDSPVGHASAADTAEKEKMAAAAAAAAAGDSGSGPLVDYAELERCFYPTYMPTYAAALRATGLRRPWPYWRQGLFSSLEDISRLPLDRCDDKREALMTFEEWYGLFWNYHQPFNTLAFLCTVTAQSMLYTREFIESLADYLAERHALIEDPKLKKSPILFLGAKTGKMGGLLNGTGKLPVPVIHTHENPNTNPYLLVIPPDKQRDFKPSPIVKLKNQQALEKYEPAIVLLSDMVNHEDPTVQIRQQGSVREYYYFGVPDSYIEGHAWDTWGYFKYRDQGDGGKAAGKPTMRERLSKIPPFMQDGFVKLSYPHISRWMLHKLDGDLQMGNSTMTGWLRRPVLPNFNTRMAYRLARYKPFF